MDCKSCHYTKSYCKTCRELDKSKGRSRELERMMRHDGHKRKAGAMIQVRWA